MCWYIPVRLILAGHIMVTVLLSCYTCIGDNCLEHDGENDQ